MSAWGTVKTYAQNTEVIYYSPNIVRVVKTPTDAKVEHHSWVVTATPQAGNAKNVLVKKDDIGRLTFTDKKGNVLLAVTVLFRVLSWMSRNQFMGWGCSKTER